MSKNNKDYYDSHKEYFTIWYKEYVNSKIGRARRLLTAYNKQDKKANRKKGDLTPEWIAENILTKPCVHCGESDWTKIGCNRLNNIFPHTKDNVEPCCKKCNDELAKIERQKPVFQYNLDGTFVSKWISAKIAAETLGIDETSINRCCYGGYFDKRKNKWINIKQAGGFIWKK